MAFTFEKTKLPGVIIIQPQMFGDSRGYFMETYKKSDYAAAGIDKEFVQDNESSSTKGVGFAHGFLVLSDTAEFVYKCTDVYDPTSEGGIPWNDDAVAVDWPKLDVPYKTSEKDEKHEGFATQDFSWAAKWL